MNKLVLPLIFIILASCCIQQEDEGIFLETNIEVEEYVWSNNELQQYGFIQDEMFYVEFKATKYLSNTDSFMTIQIDIPEVIEIISGDTQWQGKDVSKKVIMGLEASKKGVYEIKMTATNEANYYTSTKKITLCIGEDVEEIETYCTGEIPAPPLPS